MHQCELLIPDHGEGGGEVVDVVERGTGRGRVLLLDHRHVRGGRVRHAAGHDTQIRGSEYNNN